MAEGGPIAATAPCRPSPPAGVIHRSNVERAVLVAKARHGGGGDWRPAGCTCGSWVGRRRSLVPYVTLMRAEGPRHGRRRVFMLRSQAPSSLSPGKRRGRWAPENAATIGGASSSTGRDLLCSPRD